MTQKEMAAFLDLARRFRDTPIVDDDFPGMRNEFDKALWGYLAEMQQTPLKQIPTVVCLCGSTRFKQAFIEANFKETMAGKVVLSVGLYGHADAKVYKPTEEEKQRLDELHLRKIDMADEVLILNCRVLVCTNCGKPCDGVDRHGKSLCHWGTTETRAYIGDSTRNELKYARSKGKVIRSLNPLEE